MEAFQNAFYEDGRDVLALDVQADVAARWGVTAQALSQAFASEAVQKKAQKEMDEAEEILGDFVVYPTLFVKTDDGELHAVPFDEVEAKIEAALASGESLNAVSGSACGLNGECCIR